MTKHYIFTGLLSLLFSYLLLRPGDLHAQVSTYAFTSGPGTFTPITGGVVYGDATSDDQRFVDPAAPLGGTVTTGVGIPIGFNFTFNGIVFDRMAVNNNGWITLGQSALTPAVNNASTSSYTALQSTATTTPTYLRNRIAAFARDLQAQAGASLRVEVLGTAPNQVCVIQWLNYKKFGTNGTGDNLNFQIRLYETSNVVETVYGTMTNNANANAPQIGLGGTVPTDFNNRVVTTDWLASTPGAVNTASATLSATVFPPSGTTFRWAGPPATPPTPVQAGGSPTCTAGTTLTATGTPAANVTWYWQTSATGTSLAIPYSGPYAVFANGTYYLRAYSSVTSAWSTNSSSVTVTNFPLAPAPPAPTAAQDPSCAPAGTNLTVSAPPAGYTYYWQGTTAGGTSNALNAATPYNATATGTYYVANYETATECWSTTSSISITVSTVIPQVPTVSVNTLNICSGTPSAPISANGTSFTNGSLATIQTGGNGCTNGNMFNLTAAGNPVTLTSMNVTPNATSTQNVVIYYKTGTYVGSETNMAAWTLLGTYSITGTAGTAINVDHADFVIPAGTTYGIYVNYNAQYTDLSTTYSNSALTVTTGSGFCTAFSGPIVGRTFNGTFFYTTGSTASVSWFNAATGGNVIGTGSPFETVGSSVMPTATLGSYNFYPASYLNGCYSATAPAITVNVANVNAQLTPVNVTCNGGSNGSFTLGTVECGTQSFSYSVNGGAYGPIPTNLSAGVYSVVIRDQAMLLSSPISVTITEPGVPAGLAVTDANYFDGTITWTPQGDETQWTIQYGPAGFALGTGTIDTSNVNSYTIPNLQADTDYDFYVSANCGGAPNYAGPQVLSTNSGFYTFDTQCGPGFTDISTTGTNYALLDDAEIGVTLPFAYSFQGTSYTDITIGNNGGILFGTLTGQLGLGNGAIGTAPTGLYPFWDDMGSVGAGVFAQVVGTAPNQQYIVQWNRKHFSALATTEFVYQLVLDEATNEAYFLYDAVLAGNATLDYGASATIGASGVNDVQVSLNSPTFLQNNSCVHFYSALCPNPTNLTTFVYQDDAILDWDAGLYGEGNWTIIYGLAGFDPLVPGEAIDTLDLTSSDASFGGTLDQLTAYDVYIYSECQADNLTSSGLLVSFTTKPFCSNPTAFTAMTDVDSLETAWTWAPSMADYPISSYNIQYGQAGFDLYTGTEIVANGTNPSDTIVNAGFLAGGVYEVYVQAVCTDVVNGGIDTSAFVGPVLVIMPLTNDDACGAQMLSTNGTVYTFSNTGATVATGEAAIAPPATGAQTTTGWTNSTLNNTTWFTFVAPASGSVRVNSTALAYNGQSAVYEVTDCSDFATFELMAANDNAIGGTSLAPNYTICGLTPGNTYHLLNDGFNGTAGNYSIAITPIVIEAGTADALTANICSGDNIDLFTTVNGNDTGGVWSSAIGAVNANITGSDFATAGLSYNVFTLQYRMTDGCAYDSVLTTVQVFAPSSAGQNGSITACLNEPIDLLAGLNGTVDHNGDWYNPAGTLLPSSQVSAAALAGQFNYQYITGNNVCPDDTAQVVVNVVNTCDFLSVDEAIFTGVSVYPNPSEGIVFISSDAAEAFDYVITDAKGRVVSTAAAGIAGGATTAIDLGAFETGIYFIRLTNASAEKTFRVVIQ